MEEKKEMKTDGGVPQETAVDLKTVRETRGLSLQAIFEATRVSLENLTAVENGDFHRLPPPVYARNFIRKYAQAVGADEKSILARYEKYLESLKPPQEGAEVRKPWPETDRRYRFLFMSLAAVIAAGILVFILFFYDRAEKSSSPAPAVQSPQAKEEMSVPAPIPEAAPGAPAPAAESTAGPNPAATTVAPPAAAGKMYHLIVEARELTWIRITEDRNPSYQALLKPGDRMERMASDFFQLDIGNAGGLNLTFQGKPLGTLGKPGQIIHMRLPEKVAERKSP